MWGLAIKCLRYKCPAYRVLTNHIFNSTRINFCSLTNQNKFLEDEIMQNYFNKISDNIETLPPDIKPFEKEIIQNLLKSRIEIITCLKDLDELKSDSNDEEFKKSLNDELNSYKCKLSEVEFNLFESLIPVDEASEFNEAVIEVQPGVGGQEAMLFAKMLFEMYVGFVDYKGWNYILAENDTTDLGGLRFGSLLVEGEDVFKYLQFETGVHRVQRIPVTEKSGRVHTSTATVAVLPQPKEIHIKLNDKDLHIETKRASGAGGQHVNTTDSAVRITHIPTNTVVECQTERSQIKNREIALKRLQAKMFQKEMYSQEAQLRNIRKLQVGSSSRSDKIRTYNFNQDRITDHRLTTNFHNMGEFFEGSKILDQLIEKLLETDNDKRVDYFLKSLGVKLK